MDEHTNRLHYAICTATAVCEERMAPATTMDVEGTNHDNTYQEENGIDGMQACRDNSLGKLYMDMQTTYDRGCNQNSKQEEEMGS